MRVLASILTITLLSLPAAAQTSRFVFEGNSNTTANVRPGDTYGIDLRVTFQGQAYSGYALLELSTSPGAALIGPTHVSPAISSPGCDNGSLQRVCSGNLTVPLNGELLVRQTITFGRDAQGTIPYRIKLTLWSGNYSYVAVDKTFDFVIAREPIVVLLGYPEPMLQATSVAGAATQFALGNAGSEPTDVTLGTSDGFYEFSPAAFRLEAGSRQVVSITGKAQPAGAYGGRISVAGAGVPSGLEVPVHLLSANRPSSRPAPRAARKRVDTENGTIDVSITNTAAGTVRGLFFSDHPWLIPPTGLFTLNGGETKTVTFTIDPGRRSIFIPEGTVRTRVRLEYLLESASATNGRLIALDSPGTSSTSVQVSSTKTNVATPAQIPPLGASEIAYLVPGVGRVQGSVGQFLSDLSFASTTRGVSDSDLKMYFASGGSTLLSGNNKVGDTFALLFDDIVQSVYKQDNQVGTLQLRSSIGGQLAVAAGVYNVSNDAGNYGTVIPAFRSDRAVGPTGETLVLSGLRKDDSGHTNFYIQEASGAAAVADLAYYDAAGAKIGGQQVELAPWGLVQLTNTAPTGTVSARIVRQSGAGRIVGYATPVDRLSGDTWAIADWSRFYGYSASVPVVVPVAGSVRGANETFFRTDLALTNSGATTATGTLTWVDRNGTTAARSLSIPAGSTLQLNDVAGTTFGLAEVVGYLKWTPVTGSAVAASRTYTTVSGSAATFGTGVPTLPLSSAVGAGEYRRFAGFDDASIDTVLKGTPGSVRTNFGLVEVNGGSATVKAILRYTYPGQLAAAVGTAEKTYTLPANGFLLVSNISNDILGERRNNFGDLSNLTVEFEVIEGSGRVIPFLSSTDNGTGDSVLRTE